MARLKTVTLEFEGGLTYKCEIERAYELRLIDKNEPNRLLWENLAGPLAAPKEPSMQLKIEALLKRFEIE